MGQTVFPLLPAALLAAAVALSGCESSEDRAERHFNSGLALLEAGEASQALLEFRNVLRLQPSNVEARVQIARVHLEREQFGEAYREYTQVVERDPDNLEARLTLTDLAVAAGDWAGAERHSTAAQRLDPDNQRLALTRAMLEYREAILQRDRAGAEEPAEALRALIGDGAESEMAWRLLIDHAFAGGTDMERGLRQVEEALAHRPDVMDFHEMRLRALAELDRREAVQPALEEMLEQFPGHLRTEQIYVRWQLEQGKVEDAENYMRARLERPDAGFSEARDLVEFLTGLRGREAAVEEIDRLIAAGGDASRLGALRASLLFDAGDIEGAIGALRSSIEDTTESELRNDMRADLARYLAAAGAREEADELVETILADDSGHVDALKLRAARLIQIDRTEAAITALRQAQASAPRDPTIMMMMGEAHEREGARELAGERFAQAVEMSEEAPRPSLVYAEFLLRQNRLDAAESVLTTALNRTPNHIGLLSTMGETHLRRGAWDRAQRLIWHLRGIDTPEAVRAANNVEAELLLRQGRTDDTVAFFESLVRSDQDQMAAAAALVQTQVARGETEGAIAIVEELLERQPEEPMLRFLRAGLHVLDEELETAEATYRVLLEAHPEYDPPLRALYALLEAQGRSDDAEALLAQMLAITPEAVLPQLLMAERLERAYDFEGAIAIYERLYAADTGNRILANNLASLMSAHREDAESLERAHAIARRLRDSNVPAFQDTFGWIQYRRGNYDEALAHLEPAAAGLPDNPLVQFHLGMTYYALQRHAEARDALGRALDIAGESALPQLQRAREVLDELGGH